MIVLPNFLVFNSAKKLSQLLNFLGISKNSMGLNIFGALGPTDFNSKNET